MYGTRFDRVRLRPARGGLDRRRIPHFGNLKAHNVVLYSSGNISIGSGLPSPSHGPRYVPSSDAVGRAKKAVRRASLATRYRGQRLQQQEIWREFLIPHVAKQRGARSRPDRTVGTRILDHDEYNIMSHDRRRPPVIRQCTRPSRVPGSFVARNSRKASRFVVPGTAGGSWAPGERFVLDDDVDVGVPAPRFRPTMGQVHPLGFVAAALDIIASALSIVEVDADRKCALVGTKRGARRHILDVWRREPILVRPGHMPQHHTHPAIGWRSFSSISGYYLLRLEWESFKGIAQVPEKL
jgi:hypothetical protein